MFFEGSVFEKLVRYSAEAFLVGNAVEFYEMWFCGGWKSRIAGEKCGSGVIAGIHNQWGDIVVFPAEFCQVVINAIEPFLFGGFVHVVSH